MTYTQLILHHRLAEWCRQHEQLVGTMEQLAQVLGVPVCVADLNALLTRYKIGYAVLNERWHIWMVQGVEVSR